MKAALPFTSSFLLSRTPSHFSHTRVLNLCSFFKKRGDETEKEKEKAEEKEREEDKDRDRGHYYV